MNGTSRHRHPSLLAMVAMVAVLAVPLLRPAPADAAWLGKRGVIVFSAPSAKSAKSSIWFMNQDGSGLVEMTPNSGRDDLDPMFSPEGGPHVVYVGKPRRGGPGDLFVIDRASGGGLPTPINITGRLDGDAAHPAFSPAGGKIVFDLKRPGSKRRIWWTNLRGDLQAPLTCCRASVGGPVEKPIAGKQPVWSPDSQTIAYVAPDPRNPSVNGIWLAAYDRLSRPRFLTDGVQPNWSPLGDMIVYVRGRNLMVARANPGNPQPRRITREPAGVADRAPAWTPDSTHLPSYAKSPGNVLFERDDRIFIVGAAPASGPKYPRALTPDRKRAADPDWQPRCSNKKKHGGVVIRGTNGPDLLCGGRGNDTIHGYGGWDRIFAGDGRDHVYAGPGSDFVLGGVGDSGDVIDGGAGNDFLEGGFGPDRITDYGRSSGSDTISAGERGDEIVGWDGVRGNDRINGGPGPGDSCVVDNTDLGPAGDFVWDCEKAVLPHAVQRR